MYRYQFLVFGSGSFPFTMLHRDHCFPETETDAIKIGESGRRHVALVALIRGIGWVPSMDRWESFGWEVGESVYMTEVVRGGETVINAHPVIRVLRPKSVPGIVAPVGLPKWATEGPQRKRSDGPYLASCGHGIWHPVGQFLPAHRKHECDGCCFGAAPEAEKA